MHLVRKLNPFHKRSRGATVSDLTVNQTIVDGTRTQQLFLTPAPSFETLQSASGSVLLQTGGDGTGGGRGRECGVTVRCIAAERELQHLNIKIEKLLANIEESIDDRATIFFKDDECVICMSAKATMQTSPCDHRVVCRKCFIKTIQAAVTQRRLPLRCVVCRAKILKLKHTGPFSFSSSSSSPSSFTPFYCRSSSRRPIGVGGANGRVGGMNTRKADHNNGIAGFDVGKSNGIENNSTQPRSAERVISSSSKYVTTVDLSKIPHYTVTTNDAERHDAVTGQNGIGVKPAGSRHHINDPKLVVDSDVTHRRVTNKLSIGAAPASASAADNNYYHTTNAVDRLAGERVGIRPSARKSDMHVKDKLNSSSIKRTDTLETGSRVSRASPGIKHQKSQSSGAVMISTASVFTAGNRRCSSSGRSGVSVFAAVPDRQITNSPSRPAPVTKMMQPLLIYKSSETTLTFPQGDRALGSSGSRRGGRHTGTAGGATGWNTGTRVKQVETQRTQVAWATERNAR